MPFTFDKKLVEEILGQILESAKRISKRFESVETSDFFITSEGGLEKLDGICMQLIAIGESLKNLDKITEKKLLNSYPQVDWKSVKGVRDIISHHYFDLNAEAIYDVCEKDIPVFIQTIEKIIKDLG